MLVSTEDIPDLGLVHSTLQTCHCLTFEEPNVFAQAPEPQATRPLAIRETRRSQGLSTSIQLALCPLGLLRLSMGMCRLLTGFAGNLFDQP